MICRLTGLALHPVRLGRPLHARAHRCPDPRDVPAVRLPDLTCRPLTCTRRTRRAARHVQVSPADRGKLLTRHCRWRLSGWAGAPALERFSEPTREWFAAAFAEPTTAQVGAWEAIGAGRHALVVAPTGSGKTLAAFLWSLDRLLTAPVPGEGEAVPGALHLPAQGARRRRRAQPAGAAGRHPPRRRPARADARLPELSVGVRSGDTTAQERRSSDDAAARHPDHHARVAVPDAHLPGPRDRCAASRR